MPLQWTEGFCVGVKVMDEEHKQLVRLINQFEACLNAQDNQASAREALQGLNEYIRVHFTVEEELMRVYAYPGFEDHKKMHDDFRKNTAPYFEAFQESEMLIVQPVVKYLNNWLITHILKADRDAAQFLQQKGLV